MKVPSDFSHRSKLIEDLIKVELTDSNSNGLETFNNFESLMSSDICQHNLEKAQRKLLKREGTVDLPVFQNLPRERSLQDRKLANRINTRCFGRGKFRPNKGEFLKGQKRDAEGKLRKRIFARSELPELEHAFMEGIELSISDLAAFIPIYKYLQRLYNENCSSKTQNNDIDSDRAKINWYFRMTKIKRLQEIIESWSQLFHNKNELDEKLKEWKEHDDIIEYENNRICVITRRYTRKITDKSEKNWKSQDSEDKKIENSLDRHTKASKSSIQKLELSCKVHLQDIINTKLTGVEPISQVVSAPDLDKIQFEGMAKPLEGGLGVERAIRKQLQLQNLIGAMSPIIKTGSRIVDFCAGGGHFGIAVAALFPQSQVFIVDYKAESLERAVRRITEGKITNVTIVQSNMNFWNAQFDIGLGLHACGTATDQILTQVNFSFEIQRLYRIAMSHHHDP